MCLKFEEMREHTKMTIFIFRHSKNSGHFPCKCQISFSSIPTYEARIFKNSLTTKGQCIQPKVSMLQVHILEAMNYAVWKNVHQIIPISNIGKIILCLLHKNSFRFLRQCQRCRNSVDQQSWSHSIGLELIIEDGWYIRQF